MLSIASKATEVCRGSSVLSFKDDLHTWLEFGYLLFKTLGGIEAVRDTRSHCAFVNNSEGGIFNSNLSALLLTGILDFLKSIAPSFIQEL